MVSRIFDILFPPAGAASHRGPVLTAREKGEWRSTDADGYRRQVLSMASGWRKLGLGKGDTVASVLRNSPDWNVLDMSLLVSGLVHIPMYPTLSLADYAFILNDARVKVLVVEDRGLEGRFRELCDKLPDLGHIVCKCPADDCLAWDALLSGDDAVDEVVLPQAAMEITPDDLATIIYTSGTTGHPKGVMLSHRNLVSNFTAVAPISGLGPDDKALSALPLCHVYERMLNYAYQYLGMEICYAESFSSIAANLREVSPTIVCMVPRILEKFYSALLEKGRNRSGLTRAIYLMAMRFGLRYDPSGRQGPLGYLRRSFFDLLVYRHWRNALGGKLRIIVSGGAALQARLAGLFWAAGIMVTEGYGLTETSPVIAVNRPDPSLCRIGTVGPALPGVEVRIADDGEILCRGDNVMQGYFGNEELTRKVIDSEGWFHTGDIGCWVDGHFLKITDRKKEMFKTSGGKYIAPQVIENIFKSSSFIEQVMVTGENRRFPGAIIVPDFGYIESWCDVKDHPWPGRRESLSDMVITKRLDEEVERLNRNLSQTERIKRYVLVDDEWNMQNGSLTPTLKLRRAALRERYLSEILGMYRESSGNE